jgi:hypothetical protein
MKRISKVRPTMMKTMVETIESVDKVLTDEQRARLTPELESYLELAQQQKRNS